MSLAENKLRTFLVYLDYSFIRIIFIKSLSKAKSKEHLLNVNHEPFRLDTIVSRDNFSTPFRAVFKFEVL